MMDEHIEVSLNRIESCIEAIGQGEFTTADVIRRTLGDSAPTSERPGLIIQRAVR